MGMRGFGELGELRVDPAEIVDPGECPVDNIPGKKATVAYEYRTQPDKDGVSVTVTKLLPGFECTAPKDACGATWHDTKVRSRFLEAVAIGLSRSGDSGLATYLFRRHMPLERRIALAETDRRSP